MGTPAMIIVNDCGTYKSCICNGDGYLGHTGVRLRKDFDNKDDAIALVEGGDIRGLYERIERFGTAHAEHVDLKSALRASECVQYIYLFEDRAWSLVDQNSGMRLYWYQPEGDWVHLECAICGFEEEVVADDDFGNWVSEGFFGKLNLGPVCPKCQDRYTQVDDSTGECEVVLEWVDFKKCPGLTAVVEKHIY